ncbi:hypothetical protein CYMTET_12045 [Cymbomonas tetramitiformis]|uniref:Cystatin domain-containing protein n=1 Tax=Cymbomonas tetramitiformis TaxID=36881 RepID=A0AAE0GL70_9CHLO|nr:hypothetical protein CYMTET_12045 [Cymbomonas tetramitiformis]
MMPWSKILLLISFILYDQVACSGSFSSVEIDDSIREAAAFSVSQFASTSHSTDRLILGRIFAAEKQVVAGIKYAIELEILGEGKSYLMAMTVYKALDEHMELVETSRLFSVSSAHTDALGFEHGKESGAGGFKRANAGDKDVRAAAVEYARHIEGLEKDATLLICKADLMSVNGVMYRLKIGITDCQSSHVRSGVVYQDPEGKLRVTQGAHSATLRPVAHKLFATE